MNASLHACDVGWAFGIKFLTKIVVHVLRDIGFAGLCVALIIVRVHVLFESGCNATCVPSQHGACWKHCNGRHFVTAIQGRVHRCTASLCNAPQLTLFRKYRGYAF